MVANTIVVMDEKGGAAKTTLSLLLAQALGNAGYKTCAGDLDGQCNLTTAAGVNEDEQEGIYSVLKKEVEVADAIVPVDGYDLLPGSKLMKNWESEASGLKDRDFRLRNVVQDINDYYDFVLFETPPFFGVSTTSTLFTNSKVFVLIPTTPDKFGIEGVKDTIEDIEAVQEGFSFFGIDIVIAGIVITQVDKGPGFSKKSIKQVKAREAVSTLEKIAEEHNTKVFEQYLFNNKQYKDMIANQANVFTNSGYSIPQKQITNVMNELIKTIGEHNGEKA